jgi:hypothetical protein
VTSDLQVVVDVRIPRREATCLRAYCKSRLLDEELLLRRFEYYCFGDLEGAGSTEEVTTTNPPTLVNQIHRNCYLSFSMSHRTLRRLVIHYRRRSPRILTQVSSLAASSRCEWLYLER